jgi:glyoxylase-like metal-dependent hydrolase (beta-lactamase superfamily II)
MTTIWNLAFDEQVFTSNVFLVVADTADGRNVLVDPGNGFDVVSKVREKLDGGTLDAVVLTHTHADHVGNVERVVEAFDCDVWGYDPEYDLVDHAIADEEAVLLGDHEFLAVHTPGHKDDHLCFYAEDGGVLFAGDLVFANGSFGRTDLEEGDRDTLVASIDRLLDLVDPSLSEMHTGHGPSITTNPRHDIETASRAARMMG